MIYLLDTNACIGYLNGTAVGVLQQLQTNIQDIAAARRRDHVLAVQVIRRRHIDRPHRLIVQHVLHGPAEPRAELRCHLTRPGLIHIRQRLERAVRRRNDPLRNRPPLRNPARPDHSPPNPRVVTHLFLIPSG